jgi:MYXO-CTERM domain-containing protein
LVVRHSRFVIALSLALSGALLAAPAFADIPPADGCQAADAGKACDNASADGKMDLAGTCQKSKCTRATPSGSMSYDCYLCKVAAAKEDDGGCSTSRSGKNAAFALVPLLVAGLLWSRRRKGSAS